MAFLTARPCTITLCVLILLNFVIYLNIVFISLSMLVAAIVCRKSTLCHLPIPHNYAKVRIKTILIHHGMHHMIMHKAFHMPCCGKHAHHPIPHSYPDRQQLDWQMQIMPRFWYNMGWV